jgi:pilus assembly protein Flp/PilA
VPVATTLRRHRHFFVFLALTIGVPVDLFILKTWLQAKFNTDSERGASMVEYGLLLALVAVIAIVALKALGTNVSAKFDTVSASLN